jgi:hypothetical protein
MNKRGVEVSGTLIGFVLALILLLVLIAIFVPGINKPFKKILGISEGASSCQTGLFTGSKCFDTNCPANYRTLPGMNWSDCKTNQVCCEPTGT